MTWGLPVIGKSSIAARTAAGHGGAGRAYFVVTLFHNDIIDVMALTLEEVEHIAALARLRLTAEEKARYREQLSAILDYMASLNRLDTSDIEPTATVLPLRTVLRPDAVTPSLPPDTLLALAPEIEAQMFRVPAVLE